MVVSEVGVGGISSEPTLLLLLGTRTAAISRSGAIGTPDVEVDTCGFSLDVGVGVGSFVGVVGGVEDRLRLSSLSLLKTRAFASFHDGIAGSFGAGVVEVGVGVGVVSRQMSSLCPDRCGPNSADSALAEVDAGIGCSVCAGDGGVPLSLVDGVASGDTWLTLPGSLSPHIFCIDASVSLHTLRMRGCCRNFVVASVDVP